MNKKQTQAQRRNRQREIRKIHKIHALATERQHAWLETGKANVTARLTEDLHQCFAELRVDRASDPSSTAWANGTGLERLPFHGRTSRTVR